MLDFIKISVFKNYSIGMAIVFYGYHPTVLILILSEGRAKHCFARVKEEMGISELLTPRLDEEQST